MARCFPTGFRRFVAKATGMHGPLGLSGWFLVVPKGKAGDATCGYHGKGAGKESVAIATGALCSAFIHAYPSVLLRLPRFSVGSRLFVPPVVPHVFVHRVADAAHALLEHRARTCEVKPDELVGVLHEHVAAFEEHACVVGKEPRQVVIGAKVVAQVDPGEIGRLARPIPGTGQMLGQVVSHKGKVAVEVGAQLLDPRLAQLVGSLRRGI